jgi:1-acyl-sn-glycerol-3-phosphate acyltransferase
VNPDLHPETTVAGADLAETRSPLRFYAGAVFMVIYWPFWVIAMLVTGLVTKPFFSEEKHRGVGQRMLGHGMDTFISGLISLRIIRVCDEGLRDMEDVPGPLIIACNHPAMWDALLVIRRFVSVSCIMKTELLANPLLGSSARFAGFLPNAPRMKMVRSAIERLNSGGRLLLFPEGTRTRRESVGVNEFRPGLALLVERTSVPVLPIFITTNSRYLEKGWPIARRPTLPICIKLTAGELVHIEPEESTREFSARLEGIFREELG